jgi:biotin transport system substrate-specific component
MKNFSLQSISQNSVYTSRYTQYAVTSLQCVAGSVFLGLMSQFSVMLPFTPIPITLQTFALFMLIIAQGQRKASYSVILYLVQASVGLPVLYGGIANPAWMLFPTAGYLIGFLACTIVAGYLLEKKENPGVLWTLFSLTCGQVALYTLGTAYLSYFVGVNQAFALGVAPFLVGAIVKLSAAACSVKPIQFVSDRFLNKNA